MSSQTNYHGREKRDRELFDTIAEKYTEKDSSASSRVARKNRLFKSLDCLRSENLGDVLEVGCGGGYSAEYLRGRFNSFLGIDYSSELIEHAKRKFATPMCRFEVANIKDFNPNKKFDVIFMIGVLHHLDDLAASLERMVGMLKLGAWFEGVYDGAPLSKFVRH